MKKLQVDRPAILCSLVLVGAMVVCSILYPAQTVSAFAGAREFVSRVFGSLFQFTTVACTIVAVWMIFSKYGDVRLGKGKPDYSTFSWVSMCFCAGMGGSILY